MPHEENIRILKYARTRQIGHLTEMGTTKIECLLQSLASAFGEQWLESHGEHPLKKLWSRKDALATNELLLLGDAVSSFTSFDAKWLSKKVSDIKSGTAVNRRGALFEVYGINLLRAQNCAVKPTPEGYPGYDAIITMPDGAKLNVSLKCHGPSAHEQIFLSESQKIEEVFVAELRALGINDLSLRTIAKAYPRTSDWKALRNSLGDLLRLPNSGIGVMQTIGDFWRIVTHTAPQNVLPISDKYISRQILILAPFHQNESKNLFDKFENAASNAQKHANLASRDTAHAVLIRIPETASLIACVQWADEYMVHNPDGPLDLIMLYQPSIIENINNTSSLHHSFVFREARSFSKWAKPSRNLRLELLIGVCSNQPTTRRLFPDMQFPNIDTMYCYQRGEFFTVFEAQPNGTLLSHVDSLASGIVRHAVLRLPDGAEMILHGHFPTEKSLSLFE